MLNKTSGHMATSGGIRGHSAGSVFPYVVYATGNINNLRWHVLGNGVDTRTLTIDGYHSCFIALEVASALKIGN